MQRLACTLALALICAPAGSGCTTWLVVDELDDPRHLQCAFDEVTRCRLVGDGGRLVLEVDARFEDRTLTLRQPLWPLDWPARPDEIPLFVTYLSSVRVGHTVHVVGPDGRPTGTMVPLTRDRARGAAIVQVSGGTHGVHVRLYFPRAGERSTADLEADLLRPPPLASIEAEAPTRRAAYVVAPLAVAGAVLLDAATLPLQAAAVLLLLACVPFFI